MGLSTQEFHDHCLVPADAEQAARVLDCRMDAKRLSPLWVFAGGCVTGAALIGLHARGEPESASDSHSADAGSDVAPPSLKAGSVENRVHTDPGAADSAARGRGEASATQSASDATNLAAASQTDTVDRDKEAGNSVAEVLARLETEYRQRSAPAHPETIESDEPAPTPRNERSREIVQALEQSAVSGAGGPKLPASEPPAVVRVAAPAPEATPSDTRLAALSVDDKPTPSAAEEAARLASLRDDQAKAFDRGLQQVAQMQQLAALQQATLVGQLNLLQLELLSLSPASRTTLPTQSRHRAQGGRIVASRPSSISNTDNPWGFDFRPSVLVR